MSDYTLKSTYFVYNQNPRKRQWFVYYTVEWIKKIQIDEANTHARTHTSVRARKLSEICIRVGKKKKWI